MRRFAACDPGFRAAAEGRCVECAQGTFQGSSGQSECEQCPDMETTREAGATSQQDCGEAPPILLHTGYTMSYKSMLRRL